MACGLYACHHKAILRRDSLLNTLFLFVFAYHFVSDLRKIQQQLSLPVADTSCGTRHISFDQFSYSSVHMVAAEEAAASSNGKSLFNEEFASRDR